MTIYRKQCIDLIDMYLQKKKNQYLALLYYLPYEKLKEFL